MSSNRATVLIADDDPDVLELLRIYLRPLEVNVVTASDGEEALTLAQEHLPEVALLDVLMPKRSGWEVCQALKAVQRTASICVVLITGKGDVKDRLTGLQVGADDYLVKPVQRKEVVERVGRLVSSTSRPRSRAQTEPTAFHSMLYDRATRLPTVPVLVERLRELLIEQGEIGIVFVDIEQFEAIEAEYGWAYFDELVKKVGEVVREAAMEIFRDPEVGTSRVGASSFYIFLPKHLAGVEALEVQAQQLHGRLVDSFQRRFPQVLTGRIGFFVGTTTVDYQPQIRLERQIYHGMQRASDAVRDAEVQRRRQLQRELRDIIRRKRVTTLFQPIVRANDRSIFGYEILTRGPKNSSFLNSDMLFSFARDNSLGWELEALALESSLTRLRSVQLGDKKFLLNLEAEMFELSEFRLHEVVAFFAEKPGHFVFEITERAAIQDYDAFRKLLEEFRTQDIEIAIDDAGSGYASLEAIASLSPDYLKITKGLVSTLADEPIKQDLVKLLVDLGRRIDAKTIAEGIETEQEYTWCRELGIDLLQGYYLARPQESLLAQLALV
ncbi:MAG TPA: EAL domain-containing response regulator [Thermoanaerobaculia bacterium]|nr:EAL domain-containing response regulator [Thermoanaerobaculia bacterium]